LQRRNIDFLNYLFGKAVSQQVSGKTRIDAPTFQIEQFIRVQLPYSRSVCALNVIGEYFELRLCIDTSFVRKQEVLVRLLGVRLLRTVSHKNFAIKDRMGLSVQHSFVKLMARAMRPAMIDYRMRIAML